MDSCKGRGYVPRRTPFGPSTGPSHPSDIAGDRTLREGGLDQKDGRAEDVDRDMRAGPASPPAENPLDPPAYTVPSGATVPDRRSPAPDVDLTPARPTARARTGEGSDSQSMAGGAIPTSDEGGADGYPSGPRVQAGENARSNRARARTTTPVAQTEKPRKKRRTLCGLQKCGSATGAKVVDGEVGNPECLCAACHRVNEEGQRWVHLGEDIQKQARAYVEECFQQEEMLPPIVVEGFEPSNMCLCERNDCFFKAFKRHQRKLSKRLCVPCGARSSSLWRKGRVNAGLYQIYFENEGKLRASRMSKTTEVICADSSICNRCHMEYYKYLTSGSTLPTSKYLREFLSSRPPPADDIGRLKTIIAERVYSALAEGNFVCNEDVEELCIRERGKIGLCATRPEYTRQFARKALTDIGEGISDANLIYLNGGDVGDDGRKRLTYLIPTEGREICIAQMDRDVRRLERDNFVVT